MEIDIKKAIYIAYELGWIQDRDPHGENPIPKKLTKYLNENIAVELPVPIITEEDIKNIIDKLEMMGINQDKKMVTKRQSDAYEAIYEIEYPVRFYFNRIKENEKVNRIKENEKVEKEFDGIEVTVPGDYISDDELELIDELSARLNPTGKPYIITKDEDGNPTLHKLYDEKNC